MTVYNLSNITAANNTYEVVKFINNDMFNGMAFILILLALGVILFINMSSKYEAKETFLFMGFFVSIIGGLFWLGGLIPFYAALISLFLPMIGMFLFFLTK